MKLSEMKLSEQQNKIYDNEKKILELREKNLALEKSAAQEKDQIKAEKLASSISENTAKLAGLEKNNIELTDKLKEKKTEIENRIESFKSIPNLPPHVLKIIEDGQAELEAHSKLVIEHDNAKQKGIQGLGGFFNAFDNAFTNLANNGVAVLQDVFEGKFEEAAKKTEVFTQQAEQDFQKVGQEGEKATNELIETNPELVKQVQDVATQVKERVEDLAAIVEKAPDQVKQAIEQVETEFEALPDKLEQFAEQTKTELGALQEKLDELGNRIEEEKNELVATNPELAQGAQNFVNQLKEGVEVLVDVTKNGIENVENKVNEVIESPEVKGAITTLVDGAQELKGAVEKVIESPEVQGAINELQGFKDTVEKVIESPEVQGAITTLVDGAQELKGAVDEVIASPEVQGAINVMGEVFQELEEQRVILADQLEENLEELKEGFVAVGEQLAVGVEKFAEGVQERGEQFIEEVKADPRAQAAAAAVEVFVDNTTKQVQEFALDATKKFEEIGAQSEKIFVEVKDKIAEEAGKVLGIFPNAAPVIKDVLWLSAKATPGLAENTLTIYKIYQEMVKDEVKPETMAKVNGVLKDLDGTLKKDLPNLLKNEEFPELAKQIVDMEGVKKPLESIGLSPEFVARSVPKVLNFTADLVGPVVEIAKHATSEQSRGQLATVINSAKSLARISDSDRKQKDKTIEALVDAGLALVAGNKDIQNELGNNIPNVLKAHSKELGGVLEDFVKQTKIGKSLNININGEKAVNLIADKMPQIVQIVTLYSEGSVGKAIKKAAGLIFDKDVLKLAASSIFSKSSEQKSPPKEKGNTKSTETPGVATQEEKTKQPKTAQEMAKEVGSKIEKHTAGKQASTAPISKKKRNELQSNKQAKS